MKHPSLWYLWYFGIGIVVLCLTMIINKIAKLNLFWEYDAWEKWSRNYFEFGIIFIWPLFIFVVSIIGTLKFLNIIFTPFIGKDPALQDKKDDNLCKYLESKGYDKKDAADIVEEIEEFSQ
jgi:hypothetical protein